MKTEIPLKVFLIPVDLKTNSHVKEIIQNNDTTNTQWNQYNILKKKVKLLLLYRRKKTA